MNSDLLFDICRAGLLQFGRFDSMPFRHNLHMLPAYPGVLRHVVEQAKSLIDTTRHDHLLCAADSVPFGVALSQATDVPLVYSRGSLSSPARDLVGAYDVGHPAILVVNVWDGREELHQLIKTGASVGLNVQSVVVILSVIAPTMPLEYSVNAVLQLDQVIDQLNHHKMLPAGQLDAVRAWMRAR